MKKLLEVVFFSIPLLIIIFLIYLWFNADPFQPEKLTLTSDAKTKPKTLKNTEISYHAFRLEDLSRLKLAVNSEMIASEKLINNNNCYAAINAGFYGENKQPLGLIIVDEEEVAPPAESSLLNGYLWISSKGGFGITSLLPDEEFSLAFQSGPLLYESGVRQELKINNDKSARRSVAATLADGSLWLLIVFDQESLFLGTYLQKLPKVIEDIAEKEDVVIIDAINLDGGTASMYKDSKVFLNEYKPIGSMLCVFKE
jgi:uncharacterized protein YigE (DUF2233 family)